MAGHNWNIARAYADAVAAGTIKPAPHRTAAELTALTMAAIDGHCTICGRATNQLFGGWCIDCDVKYGIHGHCTICGRATDQLSGGWCIDCDVQYDIDEDDADIDLDD